MPATGANCRSTIMVASALALFGCGGDPSGPQDEPFTSTFTGFVLEYADDTRTTTSPFPGAHLYVILPDGETREFCEPEVPFGPAICKQVQWVVRGMSFSAGPFSSDGEYGFDVTDPAHCVLRLRAWEFPDNTGKTATAPLLAESCEHLGTQEGPTLIIE